MTPPSSSPAVIEAPFANAEIPNARVAGRPGKTRA